ncbi:helix-turn-helix domain-containing protein [Acidicapsa ligni]|uniref:helix-turn-helix domain-containing protein n=1 Tax=Acidicapsa ligni TaxID=542300 RepID=UPI0021E01871|nr:helix-turn-helix domain-containing protein [Acidicapsa ligni]
MRTLGTLLRFSLGDALVAKHGDEELTEIEREIIAEIRYWRSMPQGDPRREDLSDPATFVYNLIERKHANVQLHVKRILPELGISLRTFERRFKKKYNKNVRDHIHEVRLETACSMLGYVHAELIGDIAVRLGYTEIRDFNRFFSDHTHMSPTNWREREQALTERDIHARDGEGNEPND